MYMYHTYVDRGITSRIMPCSINLLFFLGMKCALNTCCQGSHSHVPKQSKHFPCTCLSTCTFSALGYSVRETDCLSCRPPCREKVILKPTQRLHVLSPQIAHSKAIKDHSAQKKVCSVEECDGHITHT